MGENRSLQEVLTDLKRRDEKDSTRAHSPLQKADEAIEIDTSMLSIDQQVEKIINLVRKKNN
jgi:cytidylate kinase